MAFRIVNEGGRKVRAIIPDWVAKRPPLPAAGTKVDVSAIQGGDPEIKRSAKETAIVVNDEGSFKCVPLALAKKLAEPDNPREMPRAIIIDKDDPEYLEAWEKAHGYSGKKERNIQVRGYALLPSEIGVESFDSHHQQLLAEQGRKAKGGKLVESEETEEQEETVVEEKTAAKAGKKNGRG